MSRLWVGWVALGIWVTASVWVHLFYIKRLRFSTDAVLPAVRIIDGTQLRIQLPGGLFHRAEANLRSLANRSDRAATGSENSRWQHAGSRHSGLDTLADYLNANPRRRLMITGYYTRAESKFTLVPDLGAVRAHAVGAYLLNAGVPEEQVQMHSRRSESLYFVRDSTNGLAFAFEPVVIDALWLARHQPYTDLFHPLQLYFPTGSTTYIPTPDNERFAREAIAYLRTHRQERLVITGHTDSTGTEARNRHLSRLRAMTVRDQLIKQGASKQDFRLVAQGDKSPIATNALPEGREANRRVTLVIQRR